MADTEQTTLIDGYVDVGTLNLLSKKKSDVKNFNAQYPILKIKYTRVFHDRFLILDQATAYHIGAPLKDY